MKQAPRRTISIEDLNYNSLCILYSFMSYIHSQFLFLSFPSISSEFVLVGHLNGYIIHIIHLLHCHTLYIFQFTQYRCCSRTIPFSFIVSIGNGSHIFLGLELGHLLSKSDCSEGWQFTVNNSEELQDSLVVFFVSVDSDKQHLALVLLGIFFQNSNLA